MQKLLLVYCHSENRATSQIWKVLPNMVFPPIWVEKMASFWACACKLSWTLLSHARVEPLYGAGRKESSGTGLPSSITDTICPDQSPARVNFFSRHWAPHASLLWAVIHERLNVIVGFSTVGCRLRFYKQQKLLHAVHVFSKPRLRISCSNHHQSFSCDTFTADFSFFLLVSFFALTWSLTSSWRREKKAEDDFTGL